MPPSINSRPSRDDRPEHGGDGGGGGERGIEVAAFETARPWPKKSVAVTFSGIFSSAKSSGIASGRNDFRMRSMLNWPTRKPPSTISPMLPGRARHMRLATSMRRLSTECA